MNPGAIAYQNYGQPETQEFTLEAGDETERCVWHTGSRSEGIREVTELPTIRAMSGELGLIRRGRRGREEN